MWIWSWRTYDMYSVSFLNRVWHKAVYLVVSVCQIDSSYVLDKSNWGIQLNWTSSIREHRRAAICYYRRRLLGVATCSGQSGMPHLARHLAASDGLGAATSSATCRLHHDMQSMATTDTTSHAPCHWALLGVRASCLAPRALSTTARSISYQHGTIYAILSDFDDHMTTQSKTLMFLLSEYL